IPLMQKQPDYLTKNRIRIYDRSGQEIPPQQVNWYSDEATRYMFRQDPGEINSMGSVKINFPSPDGVYMHDTPNKDLFGNEQRFDSSGCVRVQNVRSVVYWLLRDTPGWGPEQVDRMWRSGERKDVRLAQPVPLRWVYISAWAMPDGVVHFRDDIYKKDGIEQMVAEAGGARAYAPVQSGSFTPPAQAQQGQPYPAVQYQQPQYAPQPQYQSH